MASTTSPNLFSSRSTNSVLFHSRRACHTVSASAELSCSSCSIDSPSVSDTRRAANWDNGTEGKINSGRGGSSVSGLIGSAESSPWLVVPIGSVLSLMESSSGLIDSALGTWSMGVVRWVYLWKAPCYHWLEFL